MWYLHGPDRSVPYEVTMKAVNDLYKEGYFKRFGISNYAALVGTSYFFSLLITLTQVGGSGNSWYLPGQWVHPADSVPRDL